MKKIWLQIPILLAALGASSPLFAATVHPFEAPPVLTERAAPGLLATSLAVGPAPAALPSPCKPQGSIARSGSDVTVKLDFVRAQFTINNPDPTDPQPKGEDPVELRSYGGCKSGPVISVRPGDTLHVDLTNRLDKDDPTCWDSPPATLGLPPGVGCFNTTNLHTHGLHVSPSGNSDNVLLNIAPQTYFPYEINIPGDHPAGTFWYHAHRHGSTAVQVASGASGVLLIRGNRPYAQPTIENPHPTADIDTVLHNVGGVPFNEQVMLFQQIAYACFNNVQFGGPWQQIWTTKGLYNSGSNGNDPNGPANAPWTCPISTDKNPVSAGAIENFALQLDSSTIWDTNGRFTSVNGVVQPTITLPAGEIQRWRFVHSGIHDTVNVQVVRASAAQTSMMANSGLSGNRQQQKTDLLSLCDAKPETLIPQFEIANDGLTRAKLHEIHASAVGGVLESNYLQPGYRSDILVAFPSEGWYCLLDQAAPPSERVTNGGGGQGPSTPQLLAYVHVQGGKAVAGSLRDYIAQTLFDANAQLPLPVREGLRLGDLRPWAPFLDLPPATGFQRANFAINFPLFQVNGKSYDPDVINITRQVNTTDDWELTAQGEPHIFHIHVNPFEVVDVTTINANGEQQSIFDKDGNCLPVISGDKQQLANQYCGMYHVFRDTVFVENNYQVHIRTKYDRYIGEYVIHCHILDHEDAGMMLNIAIVPDLSAPGGGLGMLGMKHGAAAAAAVAAPLTMPMPMTMPMRH